MTLADIWYGIAADVVERIQQTPSQILAIWAVTAGVILVAALYILLYLVAPVPRPPRPSEKKYQTILPDGKTSGPCELPCWHDTWRARKEASRNGKGSREEDTQVEDAEVFMSVVVPAYNEQDRLGGMLEEAVEFLQRTYGDAHGAASRSPSPSPARSPAKKRRNANGRPGGAPASANGTAQTPAPARGWEILVVSDGSTDATVSTALSFARSHQLSQHPAPAAAAAAAERGPWSPTKPRATHIAHGSIRVLALEQNRGKGGAVTHGMRHARGRWVVFADADGASRFADLAALLRAAEAIQDARGCAVAIGSRAHLVGSEAVVKRSMLRNALMRAFHLFIRLLTPPATSRVRDTQCGFKLFSRPTLPLIVPHMHMEGWIFDVEMLMLAEAARVPVAEVPVAWKEVTGSKLNVLWDSLGMAWGLAVLRAAWFVGVYRRW